MVRLALDGVWTLRRAADGSERSIAIPGDIVSALVASGELEDPYYARNELSMLWVGGEDWVLTRSFDAPEALMACERIYLNLDMVDTVADIELNRTAIGSSSNMFRRVRIDIADVIVPGGNELAITIHSPERAAVEAARALPYPIPASTYPVSSPHRNLLRKAQCMGGWDWGPCVMTGGLYDAVEIVGIDTPRIEYVGVRTAPVAAESEGRESDFRVWVTVDLDADIARDVDIEFELAGTKTRRGVSVAPGLSSVEEELRIRSPRRWWPAGYGQQALYELRVLVRPASGTGEAHEARTRVGFRELRVDALEDDIGRSMTIVVNGRPVFAKGANWIPADALPSRWTRSNIEGLLRSAVDANMNCLRVWGGGRYESDLFYGLCDELGILVWQDCMFSCALYPSSREFLDEVDAEIRHQARRLRSHPSIALWCGNNEALGAIGWYDESKINPARYIVDYDRLTEGVLGNAIRELDPDRTWWPSSPSAGPNDFSDNWHSDTRGDMHYWSVWHEGKPFSDYLSVTPRFCSEFGFQSFPSYRTVASMVPGDELNISAPSMEHHQRHPRGNTLILETLLRYFRMPCGFKETLYLSQAQQAMAIKTAVEYWRTNRPRCMGTLYWQLNDVWPGTSWSSLEYGGNWKLLHYEARRFYDPLLLALILKDGVASVYIVNDTAARLQARLTARLRRFDGQSIETWALDAAVDPDASRQLWSAPLASLPAAPEEAFLEARLEAVSAEAPIGHAIQRTAALFLTEPKRCSLVDAGIHATAAPAQRLDGEWSLSVNLVSRAPAFYVAPRVETLAGRFDDSGFYLPPGETKTLEFLPAAGTPRPDIADLRAALKIYDLYSSYGRLEG